MSDPDRTDFFRIRHTRSGLYLHVAKIEQINAYATDLPAGLSLRWVRTPELTSSFTNCDAKRLASAYIALSDDSDIEIEPLREDTP